MDKTRTTSERASFFESERKQHNLCCTHHHCLTCGHALFGKFCQDQLPCTFETTSTRPGAPSNGSSKRAPSGTTWPTGGCGTSAISTTRRSHCPPPLDGAHLHTQPTHRTMEGDHSKYLKLGMVSKVDSSSSSLHLFSCCYTNWSPFCACVHQKASARMSVIVVDVWPWMEEINK